MIPTSDTLLVGLDSSNGPDHTVLVVGRRQTNGTIKIVNTYKDQDAIDIYKKLTTKGETK